MTARASIPPSESTAFNTSGGKSRSAGSDDRAQNRERSTPCERIVAGDQTFHVDCARSGGAAQRRLRGGGQDRSVGGGHSLDKNARSNAPESLRQ